MNTNKAMLPWWAIVLILIFAAGVIVTIVLVSLRYGYPVPNIDPETLLLPGDKAPVTEDKRNLFVTYYKPRKAVPQYVWDDIERYAPDFQVRYFDDAAAVTYLEEHYIPEVAQRFESLTSGAHKADLLRFALLYREGGVYLDVKTVLKTPLHSVFPADRLVVTKATDHLTTGLHIGVMGAPRRQRQVGQMVAFILKVPDTLLAMNYHQNCITFRSLVKRAVKDAVYLEEDCRGKYCELTGIDRYHKCCVIRDGTGKIVLHSRDPKYPY